MINRIEEIKNRIIKSFGDGAIAIKCAFCDGTGSFPETPYDEIPPCESCPICKGKGVNIFREDSDNLILCSHCNGDGKAWEENDYFIGDNCVTCKGTGVICLNETINSTADEKFWSLLHPAIVKVSKSRFLSCHYADSVESAFKEINKIGKNLLKRKTKQEKDGVNVFETLFSMNNPIIKLGDLKTESGRNIQQGYLQIFCGAVKGIRNPKAHANISIDKNNAIHLLFLASLLMGKIKKA